MRRTALACGALLACAAGLLGRSAGAQVLYVDNRAPLVPPPDGLTWDTAFPFLQTALIVAGGGGFDEIRVGEGMAPYRPDETPANPMGSGNRSATFVLVQGVALRGGYAGHGAPDPDARNPFLFVTILDGDLAGDDPGDIADNSLHIVTANAPGAGVVLDGFTIRGGHADGAGDDSCGAGLLVLSGTPQIMACRFLGNTAAGSGAGLHTRSPDAVTVGGTPFDFNSAEYGGALSVAAGSTCVVSNSSFSNNAATRGGGVNNLGALGLGGCTMAGNVAPVAADIFNDGSLYLLPGGVTGTVDFLNSGDLSPALAAEEGSVGSSLIAGHLAHRDANVPELPAGTMVLDITELEQDALDLLDPVTLEGGLHVALDGVFVPSPEQCFELIGGISVMGSFDVAFCPHELTTLAPQVIYGPCGASAAVGPMGVSVLFGTLSELVVTVKGTTTALAGKTPRALTVASLNPDLDALPDLAVAVTGSKLAAGTVAIMLNDGAGGFTEHALVSIGDDPTAIEAADLDGDGDDDLAATASDPGTGQGIVTVLLNDGNGNFTEPGTSPYLVGSEATDLVLAALHPVDSGIDIAVSLGIDLNVILLESIGGGDFALGALIPVNAPANGIAAAEYSGDADIDIAVALDGLSPDAEGSVLVLEGDGSGNYGGMQETFEVGLNPTDVCPEDFDRDKDDEALIINGGGASASILVNNGGLTSSVRVSLGGQPIAVTTLDIEGDEDSDAAIIVDDETDGPLVRVVRNDLDEPGGQIVLTFDEDITFADDPVLIGSGDFDGDGDEDLVVITVPPPPAGAGPGGGPAIVVQRNESAEPCPWDLDGSGTIGTGDLLGLLSVWGTDPGGPPDFDGDMNVGTSDLLELLGNWGPCP